MTAPAQPAAQADVLVVRSGPAGRRGVVQAGHWLSFDTAAVARLVNGTALPPAPGPRA